MNPVLHYAIAEEVLGEVRDALALVLPEDLRHTRTGIVNGPPAIDDWEACAEHLVAWVEVVVPTLNTPEPYTRRVLCNPPDALLTVVVQSIRCEPTLDTNASGSEVTFPTMDELDAAARLVAVDARVTWAALACWALATERDVAFIGQTPVPPAGGIAGVETRILVEGDDVVCCGPEGLQFDPLPEGFFAGLI